MKIAQILPITSTLLLVVGCSSWHERQANYQDTTPQYSTYNYSGNTSTTSTQPGNAATQNGVVSQVQQQLNQDPSLAPLVPGLQMSFQNETLTLAGNVASEQDKQKIETIVKSTTGVVSVNNQLQVSNTQSQAQPGVSQSQAVGGTLDNTTSSTSSQSSQSSLPNGTEPSQPPLPQASPTPQDNLSFSQSTQPGLSATNQNSIPSTQPVSPTSDRPDTSRVYNGAQPGATADVNVQGTTEADRTLGRQVANELRSDTSLAALLPMIKINVDNSKITLQGTVKADDQKRQIEAAVQRVTGVATIDDQLQIGTTSSPSVSPGNQ